MPPLECDICCTSNETHNSIEDYYILLREFVRFRSDLWLDLLRYPVFDKMLSLGRLVIVCLPEINRLATLAVILKVVLLYLTSSCILTPRTKKPRSFNGEIESQHI